MKETIRVIQKKDERTNGQNMRCDLCDDDTHVGFIDHACTFKVCKYCDTDGSTFAPKQWPVEVLNEIGIDRNGDALRGEGQ